ncbi:MAG TPA: right-handed parallel beta-helix repeat-containing protein, partial [Thermoanaerobaculia bacterium]|nr:right-handed parallel beta-helix repeat-containing protein [Thermoanaerobaculia bacterium]
MSPVRTARWMALASLILSTGRTAAPAATFTVTTTADSGAGSLRQALADANGNPGADTIVFAIPGSGVHTIDVLSNLPIADDVVIDGYSQPGSSPNTDSLASNAVILIDLQGSDTDGFEVSAGRADIRGLALHGFDGAIHLSSASGSLISGCFIGLLPNGSSAPGSAIGIFTQSGTADTIGDGSPANRNVISGNDIGLQIDGGGQTIVRGNLIGTNAAGSARLSNGTGVVVSSSVSLGGSTAGQGNVIFGNTGDGVKIDAASGADVFGNIVGLDATGLQPLGNGGIGINVDADLPHLAGNVISANGAHGIDLTNSSNATVESNIIGLDVNEQGELGNAGAGVHVYTGFEVVVGSQNTIAHNGAGVWMETPTSPYDIRVFDNSIFEN